MQDRFLISADDSILIVIDVQDHFLDKLTDTRRGPLVHRICWLVSLAHFLDVPILVTIENAPMLGGLTNEIEATIPDDALIYNKMIFNLAGEAEVLEAIEAAGRKTMLLVGLEADVCVSQSALGLMEAGYRVAVVADAVSSPGSGYEFGLERMRQADVRIVSLKIVYYEWMRTVEKERRFWEAHGTGLGFPDGIEL